jgi:hypothetical protein
MISEESFRLRAHNHWFQSREINLRVLTLDGMILKYEMGFRQRNSNSLKTPACSVTSNDNGTVSTASLDNPLFAVRLLESRSRFSKWVKSFLKVILSAD